ncbi:MAG: dephospho-CoA kinase [Flavobacteriaceae bacterium]|nr:dephospho-CoA kinase [Flavobacteriaceae bacterium]
MKIVGLTGGIGSGKTTVSKMFKDLGVPVYIADERAKYLMNNSPQLKSKIIEIFGEDSYNKDGLNRPYLADLIYKDKSALSQINSVVHPAVNEDFKEWLKLQKGSYIIKEVAVIFEYGYEAQYDFIITVVAEKETRIDRLLKRDNTSREKILEIMNNQLSDEEKIKSSDFVIHNNSIGETQQAVLEIHEKLSKNFLE